jgi:hypothetical protein
MSRPWTAQEPPLKSWKSARKGNVNVRTVEADLQKGEYTITPSHWDLITLCYYLQRDLIEPAKNGTRPGGLLLVIAHTTEGDEQPTESRLRPGELARYFTGWEILHNPSLGLQTKEPLLLAEIE